VTARISRSSTVVATREQVSSSVAEEEVILNFRDGAYYGLDAVGARVWRLIQEPRTLAEVCEAIASEYDVAPERCERDVIALFRRLAESGLIEIEE
jgi:hypothetical protein